MTTKFSIPGIHCEGCAKLITEVTLDQPGVTNVSVDLKAKQVNVDHTDAFQTSAWQKEIESLNPDYVVHAVS